MTEDRLGRCAGLSLINDTPVPPMCPQSDSSWGLGVIYRSLAQNCQGIKKNQADCSMLWEMFEQVEEQKWPKVDQTRSNGLIGQRQICLQCLAPRSLSIGFPMFFPFWRTCEKCCSVCSTKARYLKTSRSAWSRPHCPKCPQCSTHLHHLKFTMFTMFCHRSFAVGAFKVLAPAGILLESRHEVPVRDRKLGPGEFLPYCLTELVWFTVGPHA